MTTCKQNQTNKSKTKTNQENGNSFYFKTIYKDNLSLKYIKSVFQKYKLNQHTPAENYQSILIPKANAQKLSVRMSSTNLLVLKIITSSM